MSAHLTQHDYDPACYESGASVGRPGWIGGAVVNNDPVFWQKSEPRIYHVDVRSTKMKAFHQVTITWRMSCSTLRYEVADDNDPYPYHRR